MMKRLLCLGAVAVLLANASQAAQPMTVTGPDGTQAAVDANGLQAHILASAIWAAPNFAAVANLDPVGLADASGNQIGIPGAPLYVGATSNAFADGWNATCGTKADPPWSGSGSGSCIAIWKAIYNALILPITAQTSQNVDIGATEPVRVTPAAGTGSSIVTGGTAITVATGPLKGGYVTNPINAAAQGIATAENAYCDPVGTPGSTDAAAHGTTSPLTVGQTYNIPALATGSVLKCNAATSGHNFTVVVWP